MRIRKPALAVAALALAAALGCASTKMKGSWVEPGFTPGSVKKVFVVGVAGNALTRSLYENEFVDALRRNGVEGLPSYPLVPDPKNVDRDAVEAKLKEDGVTHVLVTRVVNRKKVESYVPPVVTTVGVAPYGPTWYGSWPVYWSTGYSYVTSPGYVTSNDVVSLESNLYDVSSQKLVWSAMSETWVESSTQKMVKEVVGKLVTAMKARKVF